jgi:hypothetical protein
VDFAGAEKDVDSAFFACGFDGSPCGGDICGNTPGKSTDLGPADRFGDFMNRLEVSSAGDGKACLNNVDTQTG